MTAPPPPVTERVVLGVGFTSDDRPLVVLALGPLLSRLSSLPPSLFDIEVSVRDRAQRTMRTTLSLRLGRETMTLMSPAARLHEALGVLGEQMRDHLDRLFAEAIGSLATRRAESPVAAPISPQRSPARALGPLASGSG